MAPLAWQGFQIERNPFPTISLLFTIVINACSSKECTNSRSFCAWPRVKTVVSTHFSSWVYAPWACSMVAERCSSLTIKSRTGSGLLVTTVQTFLKLIPSMAESATVLFKIMPKMQYRPVAGPYRYAPASTMPRSLTIRARPHRGVLV